MRNVSKNDEGNTAAGVLGGTDFVVRIEGVVEQEDKAIELVALQIAVFIAIDDEEHKLRAWVVQESGAAKYKTLLLLL